jgi:poly [ADP-ribose] polymerase 10/14/15
VNSVGADLNLTSGALSSVLLAAAGTGMQNELRLIAKTAIAQPGDVFVTKGYQLSCKYVIHAVCSRFAAGAQSTAQGYRTLLNRILAEADRSKAKSIAIPSIGCGRLGYPPAMVATIMVEVVTNFMEIQPGSTLKDFHFVVLETDEKVVQAFSKLMLNDESDSPQTSIDVEELREVVQAQKKERLKRQSIIRAISVPEHWTMVMSEKPYEKCELSPSSEEYQDVIQYMTDRNGSPYIPLISKIERVENLHQHQMYESSKKVMILKNKSCTDIERILWHGTNAVALESICQYGFNRAYCGKNGVLFGNGVYCARDFSYSAQDTYSPPDATGLKRIMQCRVLTGYFTKGKEGMVEPPEKSSGVRYDTAVDDINNPAIYVVFHDYQMYPEYVITFFG